MKKRPLVWLAALVLIVVLAVFGSMKGYSTWVKKYRQPSSERDNGSYDEDRAFQHIAFRAWKTEGGHTFYALSVGYVDFEPTMPTLSYTYNWDINKGGKLVVDGSTIEFSPATRLLALNPFGQMQEIVLTEDEASIVASGNAEKIWNGVVLKRLHRFVGEQKNGKRVGHWVCSDATGKKAYEGDYVAGKRDGKWVYYYPSGAIRATTEYVDGKRHGEWAYFSEDGEQTESLTWNKNVPVERPVRQVGLGHIDVILPNGDSRHTSH